MGKSARPANGGELFVTHLLYPWVAGRTFRKEDHSVVVIGYLH